MVVFELVMVGAPARPARPALPARHCTAGINGGLAFAQHFDSDCHFGDYLPQVGKTLSVVAAAVLLFVYKLWTRVPRLFCDKDTLRLWHY